MKMHPYLRSALIGVAVGVVAGVAFYTVLTLNGTHVNTYLLVAIVVACIPGSVMLSEVMKSAELDEEDWEAEQQGASEESRTPPSSP
jgi:hypothetical protein